MRFAYADPPYLGCGAKFYADHHDQAADWDRVDAHAQLIDRLVTEYPDGWALSLHTPSLKVLLPLCPDDVRIGAWVKPFHALKRGVRPSYGWEPVIFRGGRNKNHPPAAQGRQGHHATRLRLGQHHAQEGAHRSEARGVLRVGARHPRLPARRRTRRPIPRYRRDDPCSRAPAGGAVMALTITEADAAAKLLHFLSGRDNDPDTALAAALQLADRASKPLQLRVLHDAAAHRLAATLDDIAASRP